jgi:MoaA/NifB/PqqE/SkfB family radical SAM enzyme
MCVNGNMNGYESHRGNGTMPMDLLERVLDKMHTENPGATVCPYGNGEPFLYPHLPEAVAAIKRHGFACELATNLHYTNRLDELLAVGPDFMIVSTSGFTQDVYARAHRNGDVETLKRNLRLLAEANVRTKTKRLIAVSFHMYRYNLHEVAPMRAFVESLGFMFMLSWARTISMENTVQALRALERQRGVDVPLYSVRDDGFDLNKILPEANQNFLAGMDQLGVSPTNCVDIYARFPIAPVCVVGDVFTYIRHDGRVQLCACTNDRRLMLGDYLTMTQEQISAARRGHPFCQECLRYRMNLYYHVVDPSQYNFSPS